MTAAAICATREVSWRPSFYRGEQYDPDLGPYYFRARYYNPQTGRFPSRDPEEGNGRDPVSPHEYLYAGGDPINAMDPRGSEELVEYFQTVKKVLLMPAMTFMLKLGTASCTAYGIGNHNHAGWTAGDQLDKAVMFTICMTFTGLGLLTYAVSFF